MRWGNCWLYALPRWLLGKRRYLIVRKSNHSIWPHVMLTDDLKDVQIEEFTADVVKKGWKAFFHAPFFKGHVRKGKDD